MTSIAFITKNMLVCASFHNRKIYLIEFDLEKEKYTFLHSTNSFGIPNKPFSSDLIDFNGKYVVTSNLWSCSISFYEIRNKQLFYWKSIINKNVGICHGVKFHPFYKDIVFFTTSGTKNKKCGIYALKYLENNNEIIFSLSENNLLAKDVCFSITDENKLFGLFCESAPSDCEKRIYSSKLVMYNVNIKNKSFEKISEIFFEKCHADCVQYYKGDLFVTIEELENNGFVYQISIDKENNLVLKNKIEGFSFPHGLNINFDLFGVTEYGDSSITLKKYNF